MAAEGSGVVVILRGREDPRALLAALERGPHANVEVDVSADLRTYGIGAQILRDLGVRRMRVLSAPKRLHAISGFGLEVVEYIDQ